MHMSRRFFCLPRNWIYLLQNYLSSYVHLKDINKTLKGIGKIQFVSESTILLICKLLNFTGVFTKKKIEIIKDYYQKLAIHIFFISNQVAKAPGLNLATVRP